MDRPRARIEGANWRILLRASTAALACSIGSAREARGQANETDRVPAPTHAERAAAGPTVEVSGTVLSIDEDDIVLDFGSSKGGTDGSIVELWRPFRLRHPVTGKFLADRFRIGSLRLVQVQRTLAFARPEGALARNPEAGDIAILRSEAVAAGGAVAKSRPTAPRLTGSPLDAAAADAAPTDAGDPEARELTAIFDGLKGQPPAARIVRYERYAQTHPRSKYARVLYEEAAYLRRLFTDARAADEGAKATALRAALQRPESALAGRPLAIGVEAPSAAGAVLHVRHAGEMAYFSFPMRGAGAGYFRAAVPAEQMKEPDVDYFIESVNVAGVASPLVASAEKPERIDVHEAPRPEPPAKADAMVALFTDYADYNRLRRNDYAWQTEGFFGLRYRDVGVRALRSGFGVYRGVGGSLEELDALGLEGRKVGLTYGYLEGEYGVTAFTGLIGRLAIGLTNDGVSGGGQFFVRFGNDKLTNILLGGEVLGGIGLKGIAELQWNTIARVPIVIRTEVTNQPAGTAARLADGTTSSEPVSIIRGDVGARAMVQVGYRFVPTLTLSLRGSYEGRTIQHAGPGAGLGVTYTW
jgi:hypothetical protein